MIPSLSVGNVLVPQNVPESDILPTPMPEEEEMYKENIIDHYKHPHNHREIPYATYVYREFNPLCGDEITLFLSINNSSIVDASFLGQGCAISQASASLLTDALKGMLLEQARNITQNEILAFLGAPISPPRLKCALLPLKALQNAFSQK